MTGSDDHGLKIQYVAAKEGCRVEKVVNEGAARFLVSVISHYDLVAKADGDEGRRNRLRRRTCR